MAAEKTYAVIQGELVRPDELRLEVRDIRLIGRRLTFGQATTLVANLPGQADMPYAIISDDDAIGLIDVGMCALPEE